MLKFGNREFRNLQEQVLKNMCDIQDIEQGATVLAAFGIKVVGQVNQASDLPAPTTYQGNLGDAFLVGTEAPYDYYIYAKAYDGQEQPAFYNLGQFPKQGPKGDKGDAAGFGTVSATATSVVGQPTVSVNTSGTNEAKNIAFEFGIPDVNPEYVEANPTAEATGTLQKLRVNDTVYSVGGGGVKCYTGATYIGEGESYTLSTFAGIKVGDIVSDSESDQVFIVQSVSNSQINLYGIISYNSQVAATLEVQNNMWVVTSYVLENRLNLRVITLNTVGTTDTVNGLTTLSSLSAYESQLQKIKVGDPVNIIITHNGNITHTVNLVCTTNELPFSGMGQHFKCYGSGYCDNSSTQNVCSCYLDYASSGQDGPKLYLSNTSTNITQYNTTITAGDKVRIYF